MAQPNVSIDEAPEPVHARPTGIELLGDTAWGTHLSVFYGAADDLLDTCAAYFAAGLGANEACVWALPDGVSTDDATAALGRVIPDVAEAIASGRVELVTERGFALEGTGGDIDLIRFAWQGRLDKARARGAEGLRVSGNGFWIKAREWKDFAAYQAELDLALTARQMLVLSTYPLAEAHATDVFDLARANQYALTRRNGEWELLGTPELRQRTLRNGPAIDIMTRPFPAERRLTPRERVVLKEIVRGASSKEAARILGISPRTIEFHRSNIMAKLGVRTTVDLVRTVLSEE